MNYRELGRTGLRVSEIGFGGEWLEHHDTKEIVEMFHFASEKGINILDCWMPDPTVRANIGAGIKGFRERWIIQGHFGSTWQNGQYVRTRDLGKCVEAFNDLLTLLGTDYIDLGMIHFVDEVKDFEEVINGEFYTYMKGLKERGTVLHIGMSTHNPTVARMAAESGRIESVMFSVNPAFDMLPPTEDLNNYFVDTFDEELGGIAPERVELYKLCESVGMGMTVMKGYAGGRLFNAQASPFGVALTPVQCLHYALTKPSVASVMVGFNKVEHIEEAISYGNATDAERDYASVLAGAPRHAFSGQCTYCGHCAPCHARIDIAMVNKLLDLAEMQDEAPATIKAHYSALEHNASECTACRQCEKRCPFEVKIAERMKRADELLGG